MKEARLFFYYHVLKDADSFDLDANAVARSQILRWFHFETYACWSARGDDVARFQRHDAGEVVQDFADVQGHVFC